MHTVIKRWKRIREMSGRRMERLWWWQETGVVWIIEERRAPQLPLNYSRVHEGHKDHGLEKLATMKSFSLLTLVQTNQSWESC